MLDIKCSYSFEFEKSSYPIFLDTEILPLNYDNERNLYINVVAQYAFNFVKYYNYKPTFDYFMKLIFDDGVAQSTKISDKWKLQFSLDPYESTGGIDVASAQAKYTISYKL